MQLIEEYLQQQSWRNWEQYLDKLPLQAQDRVLDLGCSVGAVSDLFAERAAQVWGIDLNPEFIAYCQAKQQTNQAFLCSDFAALKLQDFKDFNGVWASFSISYSPDPLQFLSALYRHLAPQGWIALLDIACFISGNMSEKSRYYAQVKAFELNSASAGFYDFNFGTKMESLLRQAGFQILLTDTERQDLELNFVGPARADVLACWQARLQRLPRLKAELGNAYPDFCNEFLDHLQSPEHDSRQTLILTIGKKEQCSA
ncbi:methyltransferase type 11 [bacterium (Candidatus Blackallbacteria) CG17_big_fil_post_rev_8_21_14_2_50_48_46]|uniref:Methyltransferase type 11 n=1 Tax=bacterium (Candidatus Blackallbacteria) CG17_big_fil_post_rev_8_21_14_2_50_48_46 TaxID=2014261 RepID=A0A2M7G8X8_9BACT|nr:MAG: methyltransferase type 11 [bacterium (Candidatus Blackallbacteria) CG18_big_fil_WC_8_21_14_2_50_49_26]PIW18560.1 MAG: methyltransferase type 11 [bacterium (Candidatus Blackallbacteria) CG17_big_fil_post_rev_8_21_14_2_50_48_46]PIW46455.1 MAG: methyltransferase type 11 [bacterium (Candidatus Blackallbacteria) CG13_big_fil_rev_8_21_14_2_50_49_14]